MSNDRGSILLVDHSRGNLMFQETILRSRNANIRTALAGSDALHRAIGESPNLIIFGFDLFDMSAPEFCREIRGNEKTRSISLLLVCDRQKTDQVDLCLSAGCNDIVYRPLQRRELDSKIEKLTAIPVRRELRTITRIEVSLEREGRFILGRSINISSNGILVEVERVLPSDGPVILHFYLPGDARLLQLRGELLRAEFAGARARYGIRFMRPTGLERERIEQYVHRIRSRDLI